MFLKPPSKIPHPERTSGHCCKPEGCRVTPTAPQWSLSSLPVGLTGSVGSCSLRNCTMRERLHKHLGWSEQLHQETSQSQSNAIQIVPAVPEPFGSLEFAMYDSKTCPAWSLGETFPTRCLERCLVDLWVT